VNDTFYSLHICQYPIFSGHNSCGTNHTGQSFKTGTTVFCPTAFVVLGTGDHQQPTQKLAQELGMDDYFYDILPAQKAQIVEKLQKEGKKVCFIGDGINDAIAMKKANVSISLRGATSIATDTAEIILMDSSLSRLCDLIDISKNLNSNLHTSLAVTLMFGAINLAGAFLLHFSRFVIAERNYFMHVP
jgi:P-type E1-E2 ATPase